MTLRIFEEANEVEAVIALHGWLSAAEVSELERLAAAHDGPLRVDLAHLVGVDTEGLRVLKRLRGRGVCIAGASPFVELLLERTSEPER
jgi:anti-anti-sigma regulatory factor